LWNKLILEVEWEARVRDAGTSNEVVLEGTNGMFSTIVVVDARRDQLIVNALSINVVLEDEGCLIVQPL
jgi:hypothetical protein